MNPLLRLLVWRALELRLQISSEDAWAEKVETLAALSGRRVEFFRMLDALERQGKVNTCIVSG